MKKNEMGWHKARMGDWRVAYRVFGGGRVPTERYYLEDLVVDRRIILKSIFKK